MTQFNSRFRLSLDDIHCLAIPSKFFPGYFRPIDYIPLLGYPTAILKTTNDEKLGILHFVDYNNTPKYEITPLPNPTPITDAFIAAMNYGKIVPLSFDINTLTNLPISDKYTFICQDMKKVTWEQVKWNYVDTPINLTVVYATTTYCEQYYDWSVYRQVYKNFAEKNNYFRVNAIFCELEQSYIHKSKFPNDWDFTFSQYHDHGELRHIEGDQFELRQKECECCLTKKAIRKFCYRPVLQELKMQVKIIY